MAIGPTSFTTLCTLCDYKMRHYLQSSGSSPDTPQPSKHQGRPQLIQECLLEVLTSTTPNNNLCQAAPIQSRCNNQTTVHHDTHTEGINTYVFFSLTFLLDFILFSSQRLVLTWRRRPAGSWASPATCCAAPATCWASSTSARSSPSAGSAVSRRPSSRRARWDRPQGPLWSFI